MKYANHTYGIYKKLALKQRIGVQQRTVLETIVCLHQILRLLQRATQATD